MTTLIPLCPTEDVLEDEILGAELPDGHKLAVYHLHGNYYVTDDTCTHEEASLSEEGAVDGDQVICGWHFCGFDIATGAATASPCSEPLRSYPVQVIDGVIHVER